VVFACAQNILIYYYLSYRTDDGVYNIIASMGYNTYNRVVVRQKRGRQINIVNGHLVCVILSDCPRQYRRGCPFFDNVSWGSIVSCLRVVHTHIPTHTHTHTRLHTNVLAAGTWCAVYSLKRRSIVWARTPASGRLPKLLRQVVRLPKYVQCSHVVGMQSNQSRC